MTHFIPWFPFKTYPIPNSSRLVFPLIKAPAALSLWMTVASNGLSWLRKIAEAQVVGLSLVHILSFTAISRPAIEDFE